MSQPTQYEACIAHNCREPRHADGVEFCHHHEAQLQDFQQWLDGLDADGCAVARSFDFERAIWNERRPSA